MSKPILALLLAFGLLAGTAPVRAAERVTTPPTIQEVSSQRFDFAIAISIREGTLVTFYGKGEETIDRLHAVAVDNLTGDVVEVVVVGDTIYERENTNTRWKGSKVSDDTLPVSAPAAPGAAPDAAPAIFNVGEANVNGAPTTQYQIPIDAAALPQDSGFTSATLDVFIGKNDNFVHKEQVTLRGTDPDLGDFVLQSVRVNSAFNQPLVIGAPPSDVVDMEPTTGAARYRFAGSRVFPTWARVYAAHALRELRAGR